MNSMKGTIYFIQFLLLAFLCISCANDVRTNDPEAMSIAKQLAKVDSYELGIRLKADILKAAEFDEKTYRGKVVSFYGLGVCANDLEGDGFYLRILNKSGKNLQPSAAIYCVFITGKVLQVIRDNKIIIIEINDEDWFVGSTG